MDVALASITLVKQLHFWMFTIYNCTIAFLASSIYQMAHIFPVVGVSAGSSQTSVGILNHHNHIPILNNMSKSYLSLCSFLVPMQFLNVSVYLVLRPSSATILLLPSSSLSTEALGAAGGLYCLERLPLA
jgi:hypothetical protein